jgi:hypothetical protein
MIHTRICSSTFHRAYALGYRIAYMYKALGHTVCAMVKETQCQQ